MSARISVLLITAAAASALTPIAADAATFPAHGTYLAGFVQGDGVVPQSQPTEVLAPRSGFNSNYSSRDLWAPRRWTHWGRARAASQTRYFWHDEHGNPTAFPARLTVSGRRTCRPGVAVYTRITGRFTASVPNGVPRTIHTRAPALPPGVCGA